MCKTPKKEPQAKSELKTVKARPFSVNFESSMLNEGTTI